MPRQTKHRLAGFAACAVVSVATIAATQQAAVMSTEAEKIGYAVGYDLGRDALEQIEADGVDVDLASFLRGIGDAMLSKETRMSEAELYATLADLERDVNERAAQERLRTDPAFAVVKNENEQRSRDFHASFGTKEGVITLESGAQYQVLESGNGASPTIDDTIEVVYKGRTLSGADVGVGGEATVPVREMMRGGRELVTLMQEGDRWLVAIPPKLAHGVAGKPPEIGPSETLVFEVTLQRVVSE